MYCRYVYNTASANTLLTDLTTLLTSTTTPTLTSLTSCVSANSVITTQYSQAGWTVHDNPDANSVVLKAPVFDIATKFKYLYLSVATAGYLMIRLFDGWDATAHTGTYPAVTSGVSAAASTTYDLAIVLNTQATIYISASPRAIALWGLIGTTNSGVYGCFERSRVGAWDTPANAFCNYAQFKYNGGHTYPYLINASQAGQPKSFNVDVGYSSVWGEMTSDGIYGAFADDTRANNASAVNSRCFCLNQNVTGSNSLLGNSYPLTRVNSSAQKTLANECGSLSDVSNFYVLPYATGNVEDTINASGTTYILLGEPDNRFAVLNG